MTTAGRRRGIWLGCNIRFDFHFFFLITIYFSFKEGFMNFFTQQGRVFLLAVLVVVGTVCMVYADNPPELVGKWVSMKNGKNVELFEDGTGVIDNSSITWKTMGKRFMYSEKGSTFACDYNLSGYELTRTFDNGEVIVWVRKDKIEEYRKNTIYFTDSRNGQKYRAVKIGGKTWMAENLNYQTDQSWCYENNNSYCEKYGRLYDWNTAKTACPAGWRLPSREDWGALSIAAGDTYFGKGGIAGKTLKSTSGWDNYGNGTDIWGFSALPGGGRTTAGLPGMGRTTEGRFNNAGKYGIWWMSESGNGSGNASGRYMKYDNDYLREKEDFSKSDGVSVRCVAD
jgi:uncharacterized protein (TIGR02145 family)